ncbi:MAG: C4-type zinc ribbon domain-containing protein [Sumerlaeia bacterium]
MHPDVVYLLDLQMIDQEILEVQDQLNRYPRVWDEVKAVVQRRAKNYDDAQAALAKQQEDRKSIEQELRACTEELKRSQARQMMVKTSKELHAISKQIENLTAKMTTLEERATGILERQQSIEAKVKETQAALEEEKRHASQERERIRGQVQEKKNRLVALNKARDKSATKVPAEALEVYERIRKRHPRDPVVVVRGGSCGGCHFSILPNMLVVVHKGEEIATCDNCSRILSEDENYEAAIAQGEEAYSK